MDPKPEPAKPIAGELTRPPSSRVPFDQSPTYRTPPAATTADLAERLTRVERAIGPLDEQGRIASITTGMLRVVDPQGRVVARLHLGDSGPVLQFLDPHGRVRVGVGMGEGESGIAVFNSGGGRTWAPFSKLGSVATRTWALPWRRRIWFLVAAAIVAGVAAWLYFSAPLSHLRK